MSDMFLRKKRKYVKRLQQKKKVHGFPVCGICLRTFNSGRGKYCEEHEQSECNWCRNARENPKALHPIVIPYKIGEG